VAASPVLYTAQKVDGEFTVTWEEGHGFSKGEVNYNVSTVAGYINSRAWSIQPESFRSLLPGKIVEDVVVPEPVVAISGAAVDLMILINETTRTRSLSERERTHLRLTRDIINRAIAG
jgi:hypothetical protein